MTADDSPSPLTRAPTGRRHDRTCVTMKERRDVIRSEIRSRRDEPLSQHVLILDSGPACVDPARRRGSEVEYHRTGPPATPFTVHSSIPGTATIPRDTETSQSCKRTPR